MIKALILLRPTLRNSLILIRQDNSLHIRIRASSSPILTSRASSPLIPGSKANSPIPINPLRPVSSSRTLRDA